MANTTATPKSKWLVETLDASLDAVPQRSKPMKTLRQAQGFLIVLLEYDPGLYGRIVEVTE